jgi:hypothetical protein
MVSELLQARLDGEALTDKELMGFLFLLLVAGLETTILPAIRGRASGGVGPLSSSR